MLASMVALFRDDTQPTRRADRAPLSWRVLTTLDHAFVRLVGKIEISGEFPAELIGRPALVAANHIGMFDPFVLTSALRKAGIVPRFMLTGGLLDIPVVGFFLRRGG